MAGVNNLEAQGFKGLGEYMAVGLDVCLVESAKASELARNMVAGSNGVKRSKVQPVGPFSANKTESWNLRTLSNIKMKEELFAGGAVQLALAKPVKYNRPPSLVAIINDDVMLPIATFDDRADLECQLVQIGQEIKEDKIVSTKDSPRAEQVGAILSLLEEGTVDSTLRGIIKEETERYRVDIEAVFSQAVCRSVSRYYRRNKVKPSVKVRLPEDVGAEDVEHEYRMAPLITFTSEDSNLLGTGHEVEIALASETKKSLRARTNSRSIRSPREGLHLMAYVRGGVGIRLAQFDTEGVVTLGNGSEAPDREILKDILRVLKDEEKQTMLKGLKGMRYETTKHGNIVIFSKNDNRLLLGNRWESWVGERPNDEYIGLALPSQPSWTAFKSATVELLKEASHKNLKSFRKDIAGGYDEPMVRILDRLGAEERFAKLLDPADTPHEVLIGQILGTLATQTQAFYEGTLEDVRVDSTATNVNASVRLSRRNGHVTVDVSARPTASPVSRETNLHLSLNLGAKHTEILDDEVLGREAAKIAAIIPVVGAICVAKNSKMMNHIASIR